MKNDGKCMDGVGVICRFQLILSHIDITAFANRNVVLISLIIHYVTHYFWLKANDIKIKTQISTKCSSIFNYFF